MWLGGIYSCLHNEKKKHNLSIFLPVARLFSHTLTPFLIIRHFRYCNMNYIQIEMSAHKKRLDTSKSEKAKTSYI